jgi:hypothetical protein
MENRPFARATITARRITLNPWRPGLIDGGPTGMLLRPLARRGVVLADLIADHEEREIIARFVPRDSATEQARDALARWAAQVGWRRLWLDERVVDLADGDAAIGGCARAVCPTCGLHWMDERPEFWDHVREDGWFPAHCLACGGSLPEWDAAGNASPVRHADPSVDAPGRTDLNRAVR